MDEKRLLGLPNWATPGPRVLFVATAVAFGGGYLALALKPWGVYLASGLMLAWVSIALLSALQQADRDGVADDASTREPRWARALRIVISCVSLGLYLYSLLLAYQGKPAGQIRDYQQTALAVFWIGNLLIWLPLNSARVRAERPKSR